MKTLFEQSTRDELIKRINCLTESSHARWGRMNVYHMLKHCALWDEMIIYNKKFKRPFIGLLLGKVMLKKELQDRPMRQNMPSSPELKVNEATRDLAAAKRKWISLIEEYAGYSLPDFSFTHPFFGNMTKEQIGYLAYKHADHHLRQFKC